jgi:hypothetical protein
MDEAGFPAVLGPERTANPAFLKVPGEPVSVNIDLHTVDAVANRALVGIEAVPVGHAAKHLGLLVANRPSGAADAAFLKIGSKSVNVGIDFNVAAIVTTRAGHYLTPWHTVSGISLSVIIRISAALAGSQ